MPLDAAPQRFTPSASMARLIRLSRLSLRWQLEQEAKRGKVTRSTLERLSTRSVPVDQSGGPPLRVTAPSGGWVKVPMAVSVAIAVSRLPEGKEQRDYATFVAEEPKLLAKAGRSDRARRTIQREIEQRRAVFLSRFFPVPKPEEWHPGFWTPGQYSQIEQSICAALRDIEKPCEPQWWPDGWREALEGVEQR